MDVPMTHYSTLNIKPKALSQNRPITLAMLTPNDGNGTQKKNRKVKDKCTCDFIISNRNITSNLVLIVEAMYTYK